MIIKIKIKQVYGQERIYIVDDATALRLHKLTGQKTISRAQIEALKEFGVQFEVLAETV